jgi:DNA-binding transcriptional LysR family regulator
MLSFKHKVFLEVTQQLSFTKASEAMFISQPAVSKHIQNLEEYYKCRLFERNGRVVSLTEAGKILYNHLLTARSLAREIEFDIGSLNDKRHLEGELKLGASTTVALYVLPPVLSAFGKQNPGVSMSLLNRNSENILKALLNNEIDLGIIEGKDKMSKVSSQLFLNDEVVPVCSARSYLTKQTTYPVAALKEIPLALRELGSGTLASLKAALKKNGIELNDLKITIRLGGTEALKNFILADDCLGFLPMKSIVKELNNGELKRLFIDGLNITRNFYFVQRYGDENSGVNDAFIRFAKNHYNVKL